MNIEKIELGIPNLVSVSNIVIDGKPVSPGAIWLEDLERGEVHIDLAPDEEE